MNNFNRNRGQRDNRNNKSFGGGFRNRGNFNRSGSNNRQMFDVVCSNCGKNCQVPFKPTGDKPVYCSDCFEKMGNRSERRTFDRPKFSDRKPQNDQYKLQFEALNTKLDKIISLLQPKTNEESKPEIEVVAKPKKITKPKTSK